MEVVIWGKGFGTGIVVTIVAVAILGVLSWGFWEPTKAPKSDPIADYDAQVRKLENERQVIEAFRTTLNAAADAALISLSNDLQRAIQTRELEHK